MKFERKAVILGIVILAVVAGIFYFESDGNPGVVGNTIFDEDLKDGQFPRAPELAGISEYLNTDGETVRLTDLEGKVVLLDFWTYSCVNCIRTFPYLNEWHEKYSDKGLVILGVHTPEFAFEKERENVEAAIEKYGIEYAVLLDNEYKTWNAFGNRYWPRKYLIDSEGYIRYDHIGEGAYSETEAVIQELLAEIGRDVSDVELEEDIENEPRQLTPELYAGYKFAASKGQNLGNLGGMQPGRIATYTLPEELRPNVIYLQGKWMSNEDDLELVGEEGSIILAFAGAEANIVADYTEAGDLEVLINGGAVQRISAGEDVRYSGQRSFVRVDGPRLYNFFDGDYGGYVLELKAREGFSFNAFTFG